MPYLVDTDWVIDRLDDVPDAVSLLDSISPEGIAISIITYMELCEGVLRSTDPETSQHKLNALVDGIPLLPVSRSVARTCGSIRHALRQADRRVNNRALDLIIAATAMVHGLTLVTRNVDDYSDISGIRLYEPG